MDKTALVALDLLRGEQVLKALDAAGLKVAVALWLYSPDYEDWRLVLASRDWEGEGPLHSYKIVDDALRVADIGIEETPPILILRMTDPFIRKLRKAFGRTSSVSGMRLGGQLLGDRFVEDAYVYRIT